MQIGAKRFQMEAEITNRGKRDYNPGQRFKIEAEITNRCRTICNRLYLLITLSYFKVLDII